MERGTFAIILSAIAVFFGIVAIITSRPYLLDFDAVGVMVAILCGLITLLIGWNIYTVIDTKQTLKRLNSLDEAINQAVKQVESKWQNDLAIFYQLITKIGDTTGERISRNLIAYFNAREDAWFIKSQPRDFIYGIIDNFDNLENGLESLIADAVKDKDLTKLVVVKFYQDFLQQSREEQAKHEGVTKFLDALLKEFKQDSESPS